MIPVSCRLETVQAEVCPEIKTPKGIIFDCDGTLADTMPLHWRAWQTVTGRHGITFPENRFYALGGVPSRDILKMLSIEQNIPIDHLAGNENTGQLP